MFSGVGGLDEGVRIALPEARVVGYIEADGYCQRVLSARMSDGSIEPAPVHGDIKTFDGRPWRGCVDLVIGGFPCTDVSNAGKRAGITTETRSGLWYEFARVIREVEPRWVFIENVAALVNRGLNIVLGSLAELRYAAEWGVFSAADLGAPHLRKRVLILGHADEPGLERRSLCGSERADEWAARTTGLPLFPPGPDDEAGWAAVLRDHPELAPAVERPVRHLADGATPGLDRSRSARIPQLKALGNSCVPQCAALALMVLGERLAKGGD